MSKWYLIETEDEYNKAVKRFEEIKYAKRATELHKEKMLLVLLISKILRIPAEALIKEYKLQ